MWARVFNEAASEVDEAAQDSARKTKRKKMFALLAAGIAVSSAATLVPPGNRSAEQPDVPGGSANRTKAGGNTNGKQNPQPADKVFINDVIAAGSKGMPWYVQVPWNGRVFEYKYKLWTE